MPDQSSPYEIKVNLERYLFALPYCQGKIVLDAGCGAGLGTYLYSLVASRMLAADHNDKAIEYAKGFPHRQDVNFVKADFEKDLLPDHEVTVALEVIEHLEHPDLFLSQLKGKELVFSVPLDSLGCSVFHKYDIRTQQDIEELIGRYYEIKKMLIQEGKWVVGYGVKKPK